mmetsp:Transcript_4042/g.9837  ORF Transcript_4042/g.9837 Transcript_4042/m.9837 type:complete len:243 (-) Transcript_4042:82-810(-)
MKLVRIFAPILMVFTSPAALGFLSPALVPVKSNLQTRPCMGRSFTQSLTMRSAQESKNKLLDVILRGDEKDPNYLAQISATIQELSSSKCRFDSQTADGEWQLVFQQDSIDSPALQKFTRATEDAGKTFANFDVKKGVFYNKASVLSGAADLEATVKFEVVPGKEERISCDITDAQFTIAKFLTIPLPLRVKGGWLDFLYLDKDLRVTRGNRGGIFVHVRPIVPAMAIMLLQGLLGDSPHLS